MEPLGVSRPSHYPFVPTPLTEYTMRYVEDVHVAGVLEALKCAICHNTVRPNAWHNEGCEHYQCPECRSGIQRVGRDPLPCPVCRSATPVKSMKNPVLIEILSSLLVLCPYPRCGAPAMKLSDLPRHVSTCPDRTFKCPTCNKVDVLTALRDTHVHMCLYQCASRNAYCAAGLFRHDEIADHEIACNMTTSESVADGDEDGEGFPLPLPPSLPRPRAVAPRTASYIRDRRPSPYGLVQARRSGILHLAPAPERLPSSSSFPARALFDAFMNMQRQIRESH